MASRTRIAIDCMGGDFGPRTAVPAAIQALSHYPALELALVGDQPLLESLLDPTCFNTFSRQGRLVLVHASDVVTMADSPSTALRHKPNSSMRLALNQLQAGSADAVVSAGNTGALLALGCYTINTLPGIERPAICSAVPAGDRLCYLLDLGANVDSSPVQLHQFALMGAALCAIKEGIDQPSVALLNIGGEGNKGNRQVKAAAALIGADSSINYRGFVEADDLFSGLIDVVVCDGFAGNVALKSAEGAALYLSESLRREFQSTVFSRLVALLAKPILRRFQARVDPQGHSGATFLGLAGIVVKSHGNSTVSSFLRAIELAKIEVESDMLQRITQQLTKQ